MNKFEEPVMSISLFSENVVTETSGLIGIKLHEGTDGAEGSALISAKLADLYYISYADMRE